jgi:thiamine kinase-like enzyme
MNSDEKRCFQNLLVGIYGESVSIEQIEQQPDGEQGASGCKICYYKVYFTRDSKYSEIKQIISKEVGLLERRVLALLCEQKQAVPPTFIPSFSSDKSRFYQQYADPEITGRGPFDPVTKAYARALARIHYMNLGQPRDWLPLATENFEDRLWLRAWHKEWHLNLTIPKFALEYGRYTHRLDNSLTRLLAFLHERTTEGTSLTLINTDLIPNDIRSIDGRPVFIDWDQAAFGSLYLDLPNYFSIETALCYRDALSELGLDIPPAVFMDNFHEVGRYMGLRYLEVGLKAWRHHYEQEIEPNNGAMHQEKTSAEDNEWNFQCWFFHYCLEMALNGRLYVVGFSEGISIQVSRYLCLVSFCKKNLSSKAGKH